MENTVFVETILARLNIYFLRWSKNSIENGKATGETGSRQLMWLFHSISQKITALASACFLMIYFLNTLHRSLWLLLYTGIQIMLSYISMMMMMMISMIKIMILMMIQIKLIIAMMILMVALMKSMMMTRKIDDNDDGMFVCVTLDIQWTSLNSWAV